MANVKVPVKSLGIDAPDAGLKAHNHYVRRLGRSRYQLRESLLPIVRWETPYLARLQDYCRSPFFDSYFAITANLGTHTFFMTALPILFWCGYTDVGRALVHMLALGVFWSGFVKDMVCLPRPLSPPLQRITMSGSTALEYGFPSTHSTNAVSVAAYFLYYLHTDEIELSPGIRGFAIFLGYFYAVSIIFGRMYCGMHGFSDVVVGSALGGLMTVLQIAYGPAFDHWIASGAWQNPAIAAIFIFLAVRFHPEPADNCPCFDDSVAFAGVLVGIESGHWHFAQTSFASSIPSPATVPFDLEALGWPKAVVRIILGVVVIFLWRAVMKPLLLQSLPPMFRLIEHVGLSLPRRYFKQASQYKRVPSLKKDDNVIPSAKEISGFVKSLGSPRKRAISIGPQSEADARELIAYREKIRRDSQNASAARPQFDADNCDIPIPNSASALETKESQPITPTKNGNVRLSTNRVTPTTGTQPLTPPTSDSGQDEQIRDMEMFLALEKPRVRYDVEVVTKLVVYAGIAWLAVEGNPILFDIVGLGSPKK